MTASNPIDSSRCSDRLRLLLLFAVLSLAPVAHSQTLTVHAHPTHIPIDETVHVVIRASAPTMPVVEVPKLAGWTVMSRTETHSTRTRGDTQACTLVYELSLKPSSEGLKTFPAITARANAWETESAPMDILVQPNLDNGQRKRVVQPSNSHRQVLAGNDVALPDFSTVFERVSPGVVGLAAGRMIDGRFRPLNHGTGLVWDRRGHVVTSAHLLVNATDVRLRQRDGSVHAAVVVGHDITTDVALLRVEDLQLMPIERGRRGQDVRPGQWVAAVGNPYGMNHSITVGVVSAIGRRNLPKGAPKYGDFIQTDVAIFPGNSGGPLIDRFGQVIGLNTAILDKSLSFSSRIDFVSFVVSRLMEDGRFERGFGGLYLKPVPRTQALSLGLTEGGGARIRALVEGGPAARAGLVAGDVVIAVDGERILEPGGLAWQVARARPQTQLSVDIIRGGKRKVLQLVVGEVPD